MNDDDAELVALIDNELDETRKKALLARLETDERLRARYEALREAGEPIGAAFETRIGRLEKSGQIRAGHRVPALEAHHLRVRAVQVHHRAATGLCVQQIDVLSDDTRDNAGLFEAREGPVARVW